VQDIPAQAATQPQPYNRLGLNPMSYPDLTYSIQNCNSLNISTVCNKQLSKVIAITMLCTDIIFLSDIRLNSNSEQIEKIKKLFLYNQVHSYDAHFHSSKNKRGVGILISKKLNYSISKSYRDNDENILALTLDIEGNKIRIFSIYGPNHDNKEFYTEIDNLLSQDSSITAVLGGDWNASYSTAATSDNIDIRNMRNPPSLTRSAWIQQICAKRKLSDPFRALHPSRKEYTYAPTGARQNRSRLDFF
jgi:exonuclease III